MKRFTIIFILIWILAELGSGMRLQKLKTQYGLEYSPISFSFSKAQQSFLDELAELRHTSLKYDSHLGWDTNELEPLFQKKRMSIRVYGNRQSLDAGDPICKYLEAHSNDMSCYDRTVDQYGLGQSLLKFKKDNQSLSGDGLVVLLLDPEVVNRSLNVFRPFLDPEANIPLTKPRFILRKNALALLPNPIFSRSALAGMALEPMQFISLFFNGDYFYRYHYIHTWVDLLPSHQLMKVSKLRRMTANKIPTYIDGELNMESEGYKTSLAILKRFVEEAKQMHNQKVIIVFASSPNQNGISPLKSANPNSLLAAPLVKSGARVIDATIFSEQSEKPFSAWLAKEIIKQV